MTTPYDGLVRTTPDDLWKLLHEAGNRFAGVLSVTPPSTRIRGSEWTATDVAGHVLTVLRRYTRRDLDDPTGLSPDAAGVAKLNDAELAELDLSTMPQILDQVWQELDEVQDRFPRDTDLTRTYPFHGGVEIDGAAALGTLLGELLVHGRDIALAGGRKWRIGARNSAVILNAAVQTGAAYVAPDGPGDLSLELRTAETRPWILDLTDGSLTGRPRRKGDTTDVRVYAHTEPLLLNLYGRIGPLETALRGTTVIGGRRPWRITRLPAAFQTP